MFIIVSITISIHRYARILLDHGNHRSIHGDSGVFLVHRTPLTFPPNDHERKNGNKSATLSKRFSIISPFAPNSSMLCLLLHPRVRADFCFPPSILNIELRGHRGSNTSIHNARHLVRRCNTLFPFFRSSSFAMPCRITKHNRFEMSVWGL